MDIRIGQGLDVHRLIEGRPLILGGINIEHDKGLDGHSDADVLLHAITDALLGAAAKGDIGLFFPDTDSKWKDADSKDLLSKVWLTLKDENWSIVNIDSTVVAQKPRLRDYIDKMRESICSCLDIEISRCSIKATTCENLGFLGREEGILANSVVLLQKK